jgi:hypothetical protein
MKGNEPIRCFKSFSWDYLIFINRLASDGNSIAICHIPLKVLFQSKAFLSPWNATEVGSISQKNLIKTAKTLAYQKEEITQIGVLKPATRKMYVIRNAQK